MLNAFLPSVENAWKLKNELGISNHLAQTVGHLHEETLKAIKFIHKQKCRT